MRLCFIGDIVMKKIIILLLTFMVSTGFADECWILCQPDSYVNVRETSSRNGNIIGRYSCGDKLYTDGKTKHGFVHCINLSLESTEGWVHSGYIVYDEPYTPESQDATITSKGRVACRRTINGDRRCWAKNGTEIKVYMMSYEWSVTNKGFIKTEYIGR